MPKFATSNSGELQNREDSPHDSPVNRGVWLFWLMLPLCLLLFRRNLMLVVIISLLPVIMNDNQAIVAGLSWLNDEQRAHQAFQLEQFDQVVV
ncbi:MAG: hypothetical protein ACI87H_003494 [Gammaproteobacteria bacterium]|jgi:hypothetical protein